jgi:DNA-binding beta-propeller fold protein YncE
MWDADSGHPFGQPLTGHSGQVTSVALSPDGQRIASGSFDNTVRVWDAATGKPIGQPLTGHTGWVNSVAFSPDGKRIASGSADNTVRVWDAATGHPVGQPLTGHTGTVFSVAFSPDGTRIASGSADQTVRLWDPATGHPIGDPLTGHTGSVRSVAFSPDGTRIASASDDHTVRLWPAFPDAVSALCAKLTTNMNHEQWRDWVSPDIDYIESSLGLPRVDHASHTGHVDAGWSGAAFAGDVVVAFDMPGVLTLLGGVGPPPVVAVRLPHRGCIRLRLPVHGCSPSRRLLAAEVLVVMPGVATMRAPGNTCRTALIARARAVRHRSHSAYMSGLKKPPAH